MELWENDDDETPIEEYPGYLGLTFDGSFQGQSELAPLLGFDFHKYSELVDDHGGERRLTVVLPTGPTTILFNAYDDVAQILDQLPTVTVRIDYGPPNAGPASGGICVFFIADGVSKTQLKASIAVLAETLKSDLSTLKRLSRD